MNSEALQNAKKALGLDEENVAMQKFLQTCQTEWDEDHLLEDDHPEKVRFDKLNTWLYDGGSKFDPLKLRFYSPNYRGIHAAKDIAKGEEVLFIPKEQIITLEMAMESPIGAKMMHHDLRKKLLSPKHGFLTTYILQERRKEETPWEPFLDILPKDFDNFPIFFNEEEKKWLEGSPFLDQVEEKIEDIQSDYDLICNCVPEYEKFPLKEFSEIRMMVSSRIFGMNINGVKTDGFVPMADMLNHKRPKQTAWQYYDDKGGFVIESLEDIPRGEQVYDSYGKKCNSRFFLNYGFINEPNDGDEVPIKVYYPASDKHKDLKKEMIHDSSEFKKFRVLDNFGETIMNDFLSWVRFVEFDEEMMVL